MLPHAILKWFSITLQTNLHIPMICCLSQVQDPSSVDETQAYGCLM